MSNTPSTTDTATPSASASAQSSSSAPKVPLRVRIWQKLFNRLRKAFRGAPIVYLVFLILLVLSLLTEFCTGDSLFCLILRVLSRMEPWANQLLQTFGTRSVPRRILLRVFHMYDTANMVTASLSLSRMIALPVLVNAGVVKEVIKVLGVGTVLIAVVFHNFDKQMLGIRYQDLVNEFTGGHFVLTSVGHVVAVIICLAASSAGMTESACLSLGAVIFGFGYQWVVLYYIIWSPQESETQAKIYIQRRVERGERDILLRIAPTIPGETELHHRAHRESVADAMVAFAKTIAESKDKSIEIVQKSVQEIANWWTLTFTSDCVRKNDALSLALFLEICSSEKLQSAEKALRDSVIYHLCCGYIIAKWEWWQQNQAIKSDEKPTLNEFRLQTHSLVRKLEAQQKNACQELVCSLLQLLVFGVVFLRYRLDHKNFDKLTNAITQTMRIHPIVTIPGDNLALEQFPQDSDEVRLVEAFPDRDSGNPELDSNEETFMRSLFAAISAETNALPANILTEMKTMLPTLMQFKNNRSANHE